MISITIGGVDRTEKIEANSLKIENILTQKRDTCNFSLISHAGNPITPTVGQEVVVTYDPGTGATRAFGGVITELDQVGISYGIVRWRVSCQDYTRLLDRKLVPDKYQNMTVNEIIADFAARYFPDDFTTDGVDADVLIKSISFNYKPISKCLDDLAKIAGYDWYVDYNKDLHFFLSENNPAPFEVNDTNGSYAAESLVIRRDNSQVRNTIIVRGGQYEASNFTAEINADGVQNTFPLAYQFADDSFSAVLTGQELNVGIDTVDNANLFDVLHNNKEKILKFRDARIPSNGATLRYGGKPLLPVIVRQSSPADISTMSAAEGGDGVYEYLILDKKITSKEAARQRAAAEIATYATTLSEGEFRTEMVGLKAGMRIVINSASRGINESFIVNKVTLSQFGTEDFYYLVSLITTRSFDLVDLLIQLSLRENDQIEVLDNEVAEIIINLNDTGTFADLLGTFSSQVGPYYWTTNNGRQKTNSVVISQIYGGGGNVGATYRNDFIELHNRSNRDISLSGWSVQYTSATGTAWAKVNLSGTIPAGGYYLVQMGSSGSNGSVLPTPDATDTTGMSTTTGKVCLCNNQTLLSGANPHSSAIQDKVGYGATANGYEGTAPTATLTVTTAATRLASGQTDTQDNGNDFTAILPAPRNTASSPLRFDFYWGRFKWE